MRRQWQELGRAGRSKIFVVRKEEGKGTGRPNREYLGEEGGG